VGAKVTVESQVGEGTEVSVCWEQTGDSAVEEDKRPHSRE
jgi:hypothetical protein